MLQNTRRVIACLARDSARGLMLAAALALAGGCGLGSDDPASGKPPEQGPEPTTSPIAARATKPILDVSSIPAETCAKEVGIRGTAPAGTSVFAFGGAAVSGLATDANPATGAFCLPVPLMLGQRNVIEVRFQDPKLGPSDPVSVTVLQKASCGTDGGEFSNGESNSSNPVPKNVAFGAPSKSMDSPTQGNGSFLTDEKSSWVEYEGQHSFWSGAYDGWVSIKLDKPYEVQKIVVKWRDSAGNGKAYATEYKVLTSSVSEPGDPNLKNGLWEEVASVTVGDGDVDSFDLSARKPLVQHVALWMRFDGSGSFLGADFQSEKFAISEIEVWDAPRKGGVPVPPPSVCQ